MAFITQLKNEAFVTCDGSAYKSNAVYTDLVTRRPVIVKYVDKRDATLYERLTYVITITNTYAVSLQNLLFYDSLSPYCAYVKNSFYVNGNPTYPDVNGSRLQHTIDALGGGESVSLSFQVQIQSVPFECIDRGRPFAVGYCVYAPYSFCISNVPKVCFEGNWIEGVPAVTGVTGWILV